MAAPRRTPGLSGLTRSPITTAQYASHGSALRTSHLSSLQTQLSVFQQLLHQFSITHAKEIRSNPSFRAEFARMCNAIGVDPLVISGGSLKKPAGKESGSWSQMLSGGSAGSVHDFYYELAVRVVEVCKATRAENGGMMAVPEIAQRVQKGRGIGGGMEVSEDDVLRAVQSLEPLASGYTVMRLGSKQMVRSVPKELNTDQAVVLEAVQVMGYVTVTILQLNLRWGRARAMAVIDDLVAGSLVWVDTQGEEVEFWTPTFIRESAA